MASVVTVHCWRVPAGRLPSALRRVMADQREVRRLPFGKLLGTASGATFGLRDTDLHRWVLVASWPDAASAGAFGSSALAARWDSLAEERLHLVLTPLTSRGRWSGREPFTPTPDPPDGGPVVVLTRARIRPSRVVRFWRAIPAPAGALRARQDVVFALGIGEAPVGWQGTISAWSSAHALADYAYRDPAHREVIARTRAENWYAEELFARFAVLASEGSLDGHALPSRGS